MPKFFGIFLQSHHKRQHPGSQLQNITITEANYSGRFKEAHTRRPTSPTLIFSISGSFIYFILFLKIWQNHMWESPSTKDPSIQTRILRFFEFSDVRFNLSLHGFNLTSRKPTSCKIGCLILFDSHEKIDSESPK